MKHRILETINDLCINFLYYDRKEDNELSIEELNEAVKSGEITIDEMVAEFRKHLEDTLSFEKTN
jgi:dTDP-4-amino-4,6-dideoxygalactose transaminase